MSRSALEPHPGALGRTGATNAYLETSAPASHRDTQPAPNPRRLRARPLSERTADRSASVTSSRKRVSYLVAQRARGKQQAHGEPGRRPGHRCARRRRAKVGACGALEAPAAVDLWQHRGRRAPWPELGGRWVTIVLVRSEHGTQNAPCLGLSAEVVLASTLLKRFVQARRGGDGGATRAPNRDVVF
jgi:hypothetical protein